MIKNTAVNKVFNVSTEGNNYFFYTKEDNCLFKKLPINSFLDNLLSQEFFPNSVSFIGRVRPNQCYSAIVYRQIYSNVFNYKSITCRIVNSNLLEVKYLPKPHMDLRIKDPSLTDVAKGIFNIQEWEELRSLLLVLEDTEESFSFLKSLDLINGHFIVQNNCAYPTTDNVYVQRSRPGDYYKVTSPISLKDLIDHEVSVSDDCIRVSPDFLEKYLNKISAPSYDQLKFLLTLPTVKTYNKETPNYLDFTPINKVQCYG